jgi:ADP-ribose pyrophosphatase YjhB (NUDIX family)
VVGVHPAVPVLAWIWTRLLDDRVRSQVMWWLNAKFAVGVTGIVRNGRGEVLFVQHPSRRRYPWTLPGGWMRRWETPEGALLRELREQAGVDVELEGVLVADTFPLPRLNVTYLCRLRGGAESRERLSPRGLLAEWCPPHAPPADTEPYALRLVRLGLEGGM